MFNLRNIDLIWLLLMAITVINALIAESADTTLLVTAIIATSIAFKGRMVVAQFMELHNANRLIRNFMYAYFYIIPLLVVIVHAFPKEIQELTRLP